MRKLLLAIAALLLLPLTAHAQQNGGASNVGIGAPTGACNSTQLYVDSATGFLYTCKAGAWFTPGAGGTGTVTNIATTSPITGGPITTTGTIACATCGVTGQPLSQFAATTSAQLAGVISDETGSGALVFGTSPTLTTPSVTALTCGVLNTTSCVITGFGSTSGSGTMTFPAVAGTATNSVIFSNAVQANGGFNSGGGITIAAASGFVVSGRSAWGSTANGIFAIRDNANANSIQVKTIGVPTCAVTGAGATGACAVTAGSEDSVLLLTITPGGAGIAATGTVTITYNATTAFSGGHQADPVCGPWNGTGTWNARVSFIGATHSQTAPVLNWDNNAAALTTAVTYQIACHAFGI